MKTDTQFWKEHEGHEKRVEGQKFPETHGIRTGFGPHPIGYCALCEVEVELEVSGKIVESVEYGQHIALKCRNHPEKRWSTKNISPIGCRTIFYNLHNVEGMGLECECSGKCLEPVE